MDPAGSLFFILGHEHLDWPWNEYKYRFADLEHRDLRVSVNKTVPWFLNVSVSCTSHGAFSVAVPIPRNAVKGGLLFSMFWNQAAVQVRLQGEPVFGLGPVETLFFDDEQPESQEDLPRDDQRS